MKRRAFLFPGQGSQYEGMGKELLEEFSRAREIFETAEEVTGIPVARLCTQGPLAELTRTENLQPCLTAVEVACAALLMDRGITPDGVAGHSLGEYPALWAAGVISIEDLFRLVRKRGELMGSSAVPPGGMAAILNLEPKAIEEAIAPLAQEGTVCVANFNSPQQTVITGEKELVSRACKVLKEAGARAIPLKVSGAFHSPLMEGPAREFASLLDKVKFSAPRCPVYSNVSAAAETDPGRLKELAKRQMYSPVRWVETVRAMYGDGIGCFIETGPKKVLTNLVAKCLEGEDIETIQVEDKGGIESCPS